MYVLCIPAAKSIGDLEKEKRISSRLKSPSELRQNIEIAVIDDQPFSAEQNLKNNHFQITLFRDVRKIEEVSNFPIILCDLQGVGVQLAQDLQGAYLIEELKSNYPDKAVIAFTGGSINSAISKRAIKFADDYLKKDASIDEWRDVLDKHIRQLSNPVYVWKRLRIRLVEEGITPKELLKLEHVFVSNYSKGKDETKAAISDTVADTNFDADVRKAVVGFVASKVFDLIFLSVIS